MFATLDSAYETFRRRWPAFDATRVIDDVRASEYARLDASGQIYLDYTGASLYPESQVRRHLEMLCRDVLGNPHSSSPSAVRSTELTERCRAAQIAARIEHVSLAAHPDFEQLFVDAMNFPRAA